LNLESIRYFPGSFAPDEVIESFALHRLHRIEVTALDSQLFLAAVWKHFFGLVLCEQHDEVVGD
jgi:hypothetical protein